MQWYDKADWDSEFFGFLIGRVSASIETAQLAQATASADVDHVRCLYLLCPGDDVQRLLTAIDLGFRPYDIRVELDCLLDGPQGLPTATRHATPDDEKRLELIARSRMLGTRFWNDRHFPRNRVSDLYAAWLRRGLTTPSERLTLVPEGGDGFVICHFDPKTEVGSIELIAVDATVERRGIGGTLTLAASAAFSAAGMQRATVVTQAHNTAAQRLYQRQGFRTSRSDIWLHRWFD